MTKRQFFLQGIILTVVTLFLRITNIGYRSYLSQKIGTEGMGLYQLIFSIFMFAVTLSTSGISLAVTRMVSAAIVKGRRQEIRSIVTKCFAFCLLLSLGISVIFFFLSEPAARILLGNVKAASSLRILGLGLPFMSLCTCMKGYFLAVDESVSTAVSDSLEQVLSILATFILFWYFAPKSIEAACLSIMISSTIGEMISFVSCWAQYRKSLRKNTPKEMENSSGVLYGLTHIALPCTLSSAAKSILITGENLLIPKELQKFGLNYSASMSQYGLLQGMTMPMLFFPAAFLTPFASLLIPKITREREQNHKNAVAYIAGKAIHTTLSFGIFIAAVFAIFGDYWGQSFFNNAGAGTYLKLLAPLVPLMYLDVIVDSMLKGMDEQLNSMKYNLSDAVIRVALIFVLLRFFGMESYVVILFISTIFNASMSLGRLMKVTKVKIDLLGKVLVPCVLALSSVFATKYLLLDIVLTNAIVDVFVKLLCSALLYLILSYLVSSLLSYLRCKFSASKAQVKF